METLSDLTVLSEFEGTRVPAAPLNGPCLSLFGQILTHPSRVTFPWAPLRHALYTYFGSPPTTLDPHKIGAGWCGLSLILTAFKRLEVVESQDETQEVLTWLHALKIAAVRRSLAFEITTVTTLQDVLANLLEPVPPEELQVARTRHNSTASSLPPYQKPLPTSSTSFERGSDATRSPTADLPESDMPPSKKRRSGSISEGAGGQGLAGRPRGDSTVSTSALGSFADFSDHHDIDPLDLSSSESDEDDEDEYLGEGGSKKKKAKGSAGAGRGRRAPSNGGGGGGASATGGGASDRAKVNSLAARLSEVTGIPLAKCIETLSRFPDEDLSAINPNAPIPAHFLPPGMMAPYPPVVPQQQQSSLYAPAAYAAAAAQGVTSAYPKKNVSSGGGSKKKRAQEQQAVEYGPDGQPLPPGKKTRTQRPHDPNRPNFSYSALIGQAILSSPHKRLRLAEIYEFVTANYSYYKKNECGWQNSIRHNLSLQPVFKKIPDVAMPGKKGCFWTIIESEEWRFAGGGWMKMDKGAGGGHGKGAGGGGKGKAAAGAKKTTAGGGKGKAAKEEQDDFGAGDEDDWGSASPLPLAGPAGGGGMEGELYSEEED